MFKYVPDVYTFLNNGRTKRLNVVTKTSLLKIFVRNNVSKIPL